MFKKPKESYAEEDIKEILEKSKKEYANPYFKEPNLKDIEYYVNEEEESSKESSEEYLTTVGLAYCNNFHTYDEE